MDKTYLDRAADPRALKEMTPAELEALAAEIRARLLEVVSDKGGHLASNLGVVEATLAIHRVFDLSKDRLIWDVGHQSYVHKLLTGRNAQFDTLRQLDGISGFPKREEDARDVFDTGHSTTSISAALGIARARDLNQQHYHVIAFIGDGSLTGGMAWEALNDAGHKREKIIVILNDNEMSISPNVGAVSTHLAKLRSKHWYTGFKHWVRDRVGSIPWIGQPIYRFLGTVRDHTKYTFLLNRGGILFEEMGWTYIGPIDGHDIRRMEEVLEQVKDLEKPVILHIKTQKGKGFMPAERRPDLFHGVGPFDPCTGEMTGKSKSNAAVVGETLLSLAWVNPKICAVTAAMPDGCGLAGFRERFPRRYFDVGIAEQHAVTMAAGLALGGMRPVVCIYSTFLQRAYDQILEDVCLQKLPVVFCVSHCGISGADGETHQGIYTLSYLSGIPDLTILMASCGSQLQAMIRYALCQTGPVAVCYPKSGVIDNENTEYVPQWSLVAGRGDGRVALIATGVMVSIARAVAAREGAYADVYDASIVKPLDTDTLDTVFSRYTRGVILEEMVPSGGLAATVSQYAQQKGAAIRLTRVGLPDGFVPHGTPDQLRRRYGLDEESIYQRIIRRDFYE